ncbi:iron complex transport system substrate-binding protein [Franzmannia pantelleriensis]|uniref:Iron complex transport system substrate-binding protein n=1 Tax=Franzmannia pantelleriensis TaxID=48727 RepID=A0A1G9UB54_9GAMM|nr:iron-siderophore ABC transporter substrate-binding protein [Halomonas pantelleriensis]SDM56765.1 iron complex transport system substrate-binding protein [Halomonas pantelleriensis]
MSLSLLSRRPLMALMMALLTTAAHAHSVETAHGPVEVDVDPQRVVTLHEGALDTALAAGVTPLGAVTTRGGDGVARYLDGYLDEIAIVGVVREINIEAVLSQQPDLILASPQLSDEQYALLSRIAPTVVPPAQGFVREAWKEDARLYARALGREDRVDEAIADVERRAADMAQAIEERGVDTGATLVRWMPQGPLVMSSQLFSTGILAAAGLEVHDGGLVPEHAGHSDPLSLENLSRIDDDWLFLATLNEDGEEALASARRSPAFERLDVVQRERVVSVDGQLWSSAQGPLAAQAILDDLERVLLP